MLRWLLDLKKTNSIEIKSYVIRISNLAYTKKIWPGIFWEYSLWYVCTYVDHITLTLTLTFEGFKTLIVVRNPNPNNTSPPPEEMARESPI